MPEEYYTRKELDEHYRMAREEGYAAGLEAAATAVESENPALAERISELIPETPRGANAFEAVKQVLTQSAHASITFVAASLLARRIVQVVGLPYSD